MRVITSVRGMMKETDPEAAKAAHNAIVASLASVSQSLGALGHQTFLNSQNPGEFLAIDTWPDMESLQGFMQHPADPAAKIASMFAAAPDITVWVESGYDGFLKA